MVHRPPRAAAEGALQGQPSCRATGRIQALVWDYIDPHENEPWRIKDEPSARLILKEINGYHWSARRPEGGPPVASFAELKDDGSTACGAWIYSGIFAPTAEKPGGHNHAANRAG